MAKDVDIDAIAEGEDSNLYSDDLMPNDGEAFIEEDQEEDRSTENDTRVEAEAEAALITGSAPILGHLDEWFKTEIAATDSVALAHTIAKEYNVSVENALVALDVLAKTLEIKRINLETLKEIYIDKQ